MKDRFFTVPTPKCAALFVIALCAGVTALVPPASAANFDCAKAATAVEMAICADAELSKLDEILDATFEQAWVRSKDQAALKSRQRAWLRDTRDACADATCLKAAYEARISALAIEVLPDGHPSPPPRLSVGFQLATGRNEKMCQGVARGLREHGLIPARLQLCGVPFPSDDPGFERLAPWRDMDPATHMDLVREIFYWFNMRKSVIGNYNVKRQMSSKTILPDLMELIWEPSQGVIAALIDAGRLTLQVNRFDYDDDGEDETVYRMTGVKSGVRYRDGEFVSGPPFLILKSCREAVPGWSDVPYIHAIEKHGGLYVLPVRRYPAANFTFFLYDGRIYSFRDGWPGAIDRPAPIRPAPAGPSSGKIICGFLVY